MEREEYEERMGYADSQSLGTIKDALLCFCKNLPLYEKHMITWEDLCHICDMNRIQAEFYLSEIYKLYHIVLEDMRIAIMDSDDPESLADY